MKRKTLENTNFIALYFLELHSLNKKSVKMKKIKSDIIEIQIGIQIWCTRNLDLINCRNGYEFPEIQIQCDV